VQKVEPAAGVPILASIATIGDLAGICELLTTGCGAAKSLDSSLVAGECWRTALAGRFTARWDLHDDAGQPVSGGLYVLRFTLGDNEQTRTVLVRR
jgi:hypothetical protein